MNSQQFNTDKEKAIHWWEEVITYSEMVALIRKYDIPSPVTDESILNAYLKEINIESKPIEGDTKGELPALKSDGTMGVIVLDELPGVVFATINQQFAHHAQRIVTAVNNFESLINALKDLLPILECERVSNGISLNVRYKTEFENAVKALKKVNS